MLGCAILRGFGFHAPRLGDDLLGGTSSALGTIFRARIPERARPCPGRTALRSEPFGLLLEPFGRPRSILLPRVRRAEVDHLVSRFGFRVSGFGFRVSGFGFWVSCFGFRGSGFGVRDSGVVFGVEGVVCRMPSPRRRPSLGAAIMVYPSGCCVGVLGCCIQYVGYRVSCFGFRVFGLQVSGFGF